MGRLHRTIRLARRRRVAGAAIDGAANGFVGGTVAALGVLVVSRLIGLDLHVAVYPLLIASGLFVGAVRTLLRVPDTFAIALELDRAMRLRDRLATAYALAHGPRSNHLHHRESQRQLHDPEFASMVQQDGEELAGRLDVRSTTPIHLSGAWGIGAGLSILLLLGVLYFPVMAWGEEHPDPAAAAVDAQLEEERERLRTSIEEIVADLREDEELAQLPGAREEIDALERLAEQLGRGTDDPAWVERARDETAALLHELADELAQQARRDAEAAERLAEQFAGIDPPEQRPMSAQEFDEAIRRGDFGAGAQALQDRLDNADHMSEEERGELAEYLRQTADTVDDIASEDDPLLNERMAQLEQLLREQGLNDEMTRDLLEGDREQQRDAMQQLNDLLEDDEAFERMQRELERLRDERELQEQLKRDLEAMNEAMREAAEELDPSPHDEPARDDPSDPDQSIPEDGDPTGEQPDTEPTETEREDTPAEVEPAEQEDAPTESPDADAPRDREITEEGAPGEDEEQEGMDVSPDGEDEVASPDAEEGAQEQRRSPAEKIREMEDRRSSAERRQQASERARQRARELADSPDRDLQRELQRQMLPTPDDSSAGVDPGEPTTRDAADHLDDADLEDVDARLPFDDDDPGQVIAEWFSDEEVAADPETRRVQMEQRVREAQRIAERAVDEAAVPSRYHEFIRRYFGRLTEPDPE